GSGSGATQLPNHVTVQRGQTQIIKPAQLHEIMDGEALELAPLLQQLLSQTVPNWQQSQQQELQQQQQQHQQQQQQQQQPQQQQPLHFFVYENAQPVRLTSQQPQILPGFNGVNVQQQPQQQQQQPQSTSMPIQLQQQQPQQQQYIETAPKSVAAIRPIAGGAFVAPTATLAHGIQPTISSQAQTAPEATSCERCCPEDVKESKVEAAATPCPCCQVSIPLLSAAALKATVG
ncbi:hypothetical protein KR215_003022, partial [Drosophila sulfurigaster]